MIIPTVLRDWAIRNRFFEWNKKARNDERETHRLLDGGLLYVPPEHMEEFFDIYVQTLKNNEPVFVTETTTPIFRFFIDLDFCHPEEMSRDKILEYCQFIQKFVGQCFSNKYSQDELISIVSVSPPKDKRKDGATYRANGIHLNWPHILVNINDALLLRKALIWSLEQHYGKRVWYNDWDAVVDESIYEYGGLRMIGSQKTKMCPKCKGNSKKRTSCTECAGIGKLVYPYVYRPVAVFNGKNELDAGYLKAIKADLRRLIRETSIKSNFPPEDYEGLRDFQTLPSRFVANLTKNDIEEITKGRRKSKKRVREPPGKEDIDGMSQFGTNRIPIYENDERFQEVRRFINSQLPVDYNDCIVELNRCANGAYYVVRTDSTMCMNLARAPVHQHSSNTIYFYINPTFCFQKCFCTCDTEEGRLYGKCSEYKSSGYPLPMKTRKILFGAVDNKRSETASATMSAPKTPVADLVPVFKQKYIVLNTRSGKERILREKQIRAIDMMMEEMIENVSGKKDYEKHKFQYKADKRGPKKR